MKTADYGHKTAILEALLMLHAQDEFSENLAHIVIKVSEIVQTVIFAGV